MLLIYMRAGLEILTLHMVSWIYEGLDLAQKNLLVEQTTLYILIHSHLSEPKSLHLKVDRS
jgi:hypothetical protein